MYISINSYLTKKSGIRRFLFACVITAHEALVYKRDLRVDISILFQYMGQALLSFAQSLRNKI